MDKPSHPLEQGTRITSSGFPGAIVRKYSDRMYEIRLPGGVCCVDIADIELMEVTK